MKMLSRYLVPLLLLAAAPAMAGTLQNPGDGSGQDFVYGPGIVNSDQDTIQQMFNDLRNAVIQGDYNGLSNIAYIPPKPIASRIIYFNLLGAGPVIEYADAGVVTFPGGVLVTTYAPDGGYVVPTTGQDVYVQGVLRADGGLVVSNGATLEGGVTLDTLTQTAAAGASVARVVATGALIADGGIVVSNGTVLEGGNVMDTITASGLIKSFTFPALLDPQQTAAVLIQAGSAAIGTSTGYTFTAATPAGVAFSGTPICVCTDNTSSLAIKCVGSSTACTPTGTSTDAFTWIAIGLK